MRLLKIAAACSVAHQVNAIRDRREAVACGCSHGHEVKGDSCDLTKEEEGYLNEDLQKYGISQSEFPLNEHCNKCHDGYLLVNFYDQLELRIKDSVKDFNRTQFILDNRSRFEGKPQSEIDFLFERREMCITKVCACENGTGYGTNNKEADENTEGLCRSKAYPDTPINSGIDSLPEYLGGNFTYPFDVERSDSYPDKPVDNCHTCDKNYVLKQHDEQIFDSDEDWDAVKWMNTCVPVSCNCLFGTPLSAAEYDMCKLGGGYEGCGVCDHYHSRSRGLLVFDDSGDPLGYEFFCLPNQCACSNGVEADFCSFNGLNNCDSCDPNYHIECVYNDETVCGIYDPDTGLNYSLDYCNQDDSKREYIQDYFQEEQCSCVPNECVCPNGTSVSDDESDEWRECSLDGAIDCSKCDDNYHLEEIDGTGRWQCVKNKCRCDNNYDDNADMNPKKIKEVGTPVDTCENGNDNLCKVCNKGYHMEDEDGNVTDGEGLCKPNKCRCEDDNGKTIGKPVTGGKCKAHDDNSCKKCHHYYHLENDGKFKICVLNECVCDNRSPGIPRGIGECWEHQANECASCFDEGYHVLDDGKDNSKESPINCVAKECYCKNGLAKKNGKCTIHDGHQCEECDPFYHLEGNKCKRNNCFCDEEIVNGLTIYMSGSPRQDCVEHNAQECRTCDDDHYHVIDEVSRRENGISPVYCEPKVCQCENGTPVDDGSCSIHRDNQCKECNRFYHLEQSFDGTFYCAPNVCQCTDGDVTDLCKRHNTQSCEVCDEFFHIEENASGETTCEPNICLCSVQEDGEPRLSIPKEIELRNDDEDYCEEHGNQECLECFNDAYYVPYYDQRITRYEFYENELDFQEAVDFCSERDMKLPTFEEEEQYDAFMASIEKLRDTVEEGTYWIGAKHDNRSADHKLGFYWINQYGNIDTENPLSASFEQWFAGEPNDANGVEDCVVYHSPFDNSWNDVPCDTNNVNVACVGSALFIGLDETRKLTCEPKKCLCEHGTPVDDGHCTENGANKCKACDPKFKLDGDICVPNNEKCLCVHLSSSGENQFSLTAQYKDFGIKGVDCSEYNDENVACSQCAEFYHPIPLNTDPSQQDYMESYTSQSSNYKPGYCVPNECWCLLGTPKTTGNCRQDYRDVNTGYPIEKPESDWIEGGDNTPFDYYWPTNDRGHECDACDLNEKYDTVRSLTKSNELNIVCSDKECNCKFGEGQEDGICNDQDTPFRICTECDAYYAKEAKGYYYECNEDLGDTEQNCTESFSVEEARSFGKDHPVMPGYKFVALDKPFIYDTKGGYNWGEISSEDPPNDSTHIFTVCERCLPYSHKNVDDDRCVLNKCTCKNGDAPCSRVFHFRNFYK